MANTPQAKKRIRRNDRRAEINGARVSRIRTFLKKVESAPRACFTRTPRAASSRVSPSAFPRSADFLI
jgi:small subunit ribosomal protein S20